VRPESASLALVPPPGSRAFFHFRNAAGWQLSPGRVPVSTPPPLTSERHTVMASLANVVRITSRQRAVWRECAECEALAPLAPNETHCQPCRTPARTALRHTA
jgi:hypothetical protein